MKSKWKRRKACVAAALAVLMTVSMSVMPGIAGVSAAETGDEVTVDVYPKPQSLVYDEDKTGMQFDGTVDLVFKGDQKDITKEKIKSLLDENKIVYNEAEQINSDNASILISTDAADIKDGDDALSHDQGYVLISDNDENKKGQVTIVGADPDGAYYGVMTLTQMLEQKSDNGDFAEVKISDYPDILLRGFVEGFYGIPWTADDRISVVEDSAKYKMNTYIYAPKDDPYHKDNWRTPYPAAEAGNIKRLVEACNENNISFCWNAHPGSDYNYSTNSDFDSLIAKFDQLYGLGVRQFGISYDDLGSNISAANHAKTIKDAYDALKAKYDDIKPMIVVGSKYCNSWGGGGANMTNYVKPFVDGLPEDTVVMWTGENTMSRITKASYDKPKTQAGITKDFAAWWNYPVNDYCYGNLLMAPLECLETDVDNLSGFFLNPMSQADASKVAIFSGADYSWNVNDFDYMKSWERSISELVPEASEEFSRFASNICYLKSEDLEFAESTYLAEPIKAFADAINSGENVKEAVTAMRGEFATMVSDADTLLSGIKNKALLEETTPFLNGYKALGEAGVAGMDACLAACDADISNVSENIAKMQDKIKETDIYYVENYPQDDRNSTSFVKYTAQVGTNVIKPFLQTVGDSAMSMLKKTINPEIKCFVFSSDKGLKEQEVVLERGSYKAADIAVSLENGGYVGFNLPRALVGGISVVSPNGENLKLQYSLNGEEWIDAETSFDSDTNTLSTNENVGMAYVRVVVDAGGDNSGAANIEISDFTVYPVYSIGRPSVSTNLSVEAYESNYLTNIIDGDITTKYWSNGAAGTGSQVTVDLGNAIPLYDVKFCYAPNPKGSVAEYGLDGFKATSLQVSTDGLTWKDIGSAVQYTDYVEETITYKSKTQAVISVDFDADGEMARYIRINAVEIFEGNWLQIFEIIYNQTVNNLVEGGASVPLAESAGMSSTNLEYLYDADISTAPTLSGITAGSSITYMATTVTDAENLIIVQDENSITNAKVEVLTFGENGADGEWVEVGLLSSQTNDIKVGMKIKAVKITFETAMSSANIYEIVISGSAAEPEPEAMMGDVNGNNEIDSGDATFVLQYIADIVDENTEGYNHSVSDVDGSGTTDTSDVTAILQRIASIIQKFPAEK